MRDTLDACTLIALFANEEGAEIVSDLLTSRSEVSITAINACEVFYEIERKLGVENANIALRRILWFGIEIIDEIGPTIWKEAAHLKAKYRRLSLADAIGVAYSKKNRSLFVTSDHKELEPLAKDHVCKFLFFR